MNSHNVVNIIIYLFVISIGKIVVFLFVFVVVDLVFNDCIVFFFGLVFV